jgi:hypothetical protein
MDLWRGPLSDFVREAGSGVLPSRMVQQFVAFHRSAPSPAEMRSWEHSLLALSRVASIPELAEAAVSIGLGGASPLGEGGAKIRDLVGEGVGVCTEYHLPLTGMRVDAMLFGTDIERRPSTTLIELKQWSQASLADEFNLNVVMQGNEHPHPSQQAHDYAEWMRRYHSSFSREQIALGACSYLHNFEAADATALRDARFGELLAATPMFLNGEERALREFLARRAGFGGGLDVMDEVTGGHFAPAPGVLDCLEEVLKKDGEWILLDAQRVAYQTILAEIHRLRVKPRRSVILVRGSPGTGKTVIAVQILADALRLGLKAAHSTGGKAFTTVLRSKFAGAKDLFLWNMNLAKAPTQGLDLLLVDEAHRVRETSVMQYTRKEDRTGKSQVQELLDAAKVVVFLLDENQSVRPDEIGSSALVRTAAQEAKAVLREYDLRQQFRCGGCTEYQDWVDELLGFDAPPVQEWHDRYDFGLLESPEELEQFLDGQRRGGRSARMLAGFCWPWSDPLPDGSLVLDVEIGGWHRPWNAKRLEKKSYTPKNDPYTLWAATSAGEGQIGCIYSAQGFEFDAVGVIWGQDLVRRGDQWVAQKEESQDRTVKRSKRMSALVRNAYRVLLTRGSKATRLVCLDPETAHFIRSQIE